MNELDLYYRAFKQYNVTVKQDKTRNRLLQAIKKAAAKDDKLEAIRTKCTIDEAWVETIEKYLPFVEKAIKEDRQFIRQEGETVLIEKAKKVSKASVVHLARHSDLITHLPPEGEENLIPDKIFVVENESNYAVYENRFLYMLLCYTRDFVELRYSKISELGNTYRGKLRMKKHVELGKRTLSLETRFDEVAKNDPRSVQDKSVNLIIERIEAIRVLVSALLMTPLMNEVSKAPMLKPPITRTNVLKMDNNFKNAVALYDYLAAYQGLGYKIEEIKKTFSPFSDKIGDDLFELVPMIAFLTYEYGNSLDGELEDNYKKEEERMALLEAQRQVEMISAMKKRAAIGGRDLEEYMVLLENNNRALQSNINSMLAEKSKLEASNERLSEEIERQRAIERQLKFNIEETRALNKKLEEDAETLKRETEEKIQQLHEENEKQLRDAKAEYDNKTSELTRAHGEAMSAERDRHRAEMSETRTRYEERISEENKKHEAAITEAEGRIDELNVDIEARKEREVSLKARLHSYIARTGEQIEEDLTSKPNFKQLELEREWFEKLFRETWGVTKKRIRKELLWTKRDKHKKEEEPPVNEPVDETVSAITEEPVSAESITEEMAEEDAAVTGLMAENAIGTAESEAERSVTEEYGAAETDSGEADAEYNGTEDNDAIEAE